MGVSRGDCNKRDIEKGYSMAQFNIEREREGVDEEIEFQIKWFVV